MIEYKQGDIFGFSANAIVNTVNCVGVMGKGIALAVKKRYPKILGDYKRACAARIVTPGSLWCWRAPDQTVVYNIATKNHWRDPSQYRWVEQGLSHLAIALTYAKPIIIVVPPLGCRCGGLDWQIVRPMIANALAEQPRHRIIVLEPQE